MINYDQIKKVTPPCPICNGKDFLLLANNDRYKMGLKTVGCQQCGLVQTWPRPTPEEISTFYRNQYRQYYQSAISPDAEYIHRYNKGVRLKYTADLIVNNIKISPHMRILDIGCAEGTLLSNLKEQCKNFHLALIGVEPSESFSAFAEKATGCTTYPNIDQLKSTEKCDFDVIVVNHVLEHTNDPVDFLHELWTLLAFGGKIFIDVPDIEKYSGAEYLHIAHLFHFSQQTLTAAVEKSGFWVHLTKSHLPPHHPPSVFCLAEKKDTPSTSSNVSQKNESDAWDRIRDAGAETEKLLYSIKLQLRRNKFTWFILKNLRKLYQNTFKP